MSDQRFVVPIWRLVFLTAIAASVAAQPVLGNTAIERARGFFDNGDLRAATIELKNILQADPGDIEGRLLLGRVYLDLRLGAAAEKEIRRAVDLGAPAPEWRLDLAHALVLQNNFSDALNRLEGEEGISVEDASRLLALRGIALAGLGRPGEAKAVFEEALAIDPANEQAEIGRIRLATLEGDLEAAVALTDVLLERAPDNVEALLIRAELFRAAKDLENAAKIFSRVLELDAKNLAALLGRATAMAGQNDIEAAVADLDAVDAIRNNIPMALYLRGVVEFQRKNWKDARDYVQQVLAVQPNHIMSRLIHGIVSYVEGDYEIADEYLSRVVNATPGNVQARKALGATRIKMREPMRAIEILRPAADVGDAQIMALIGSAYMLSGDRELGQQWLSRAVEAAPDVAALRTQLALTMLAGGQTGEAIDELHSAVDLGQDILQADVLLVLAHLKKGEFDHALEASTALEKRLPDNPVAYNLTGLALGSKGDLEEAAARFNKALEIDSGFVTAEINLARLDVFKGDLAVAEARYKSVLKLDSGHLSALLGLASLSERAGDYAEMVARLEKADNAIADSSQPGLLLARYYIRQGDYEKTLLIANDLASRFPKDKAVLQLLGRAQFLMGEVDDAAATFQGLLDDSPENPQLYYLLGGAQWKGKNNKAAEQAFLTAVKLKPDFLKARVALASVYLDSIFPNKALAVARELQQDYPDSALGYRIEGRVHQRQSQLTEAVSSFEKAYALNKSAAAARLLADAYAKDNRVDDAIETLHAWNLEHRGDQQAMLMLAMLYQRARRDSEAMKLYEELYAAGQKNPLMLNNMAWVFQQMGDERALEFSRQAYDIAPNRPEVADTYGWILFNSGQKEKGLSILQQTYLAFPSQFEIGYHVAVALGDMGRKAEAIKILQRVLESGDKFEQREEAATLLKALGG